MTCQACKKNPVHLDMPLLDLCGFCWAEGFKASGQRCIVADSMVRFGMGRSD